MRRLYVLAALASLFFHGGRWSDFVVLFGAFLSRRELGSLSFRTNFVGILGYTKRDILATRTLNGIFFPLNARYFPLDNLGAALNPVRVFTSGMETKALLAFFVSGLSLSRTVGCTCQDGKVHGYDQCHTKKT